MPRSGKAAGAPDAIAVLEDEARRAALWSAVEDGYASLRMAWNLPFLDGRGCRLDPDVHHHHAHENDRLRHLLVGQPVDRDICPALCNDQCGRGPGTLAAITGERCAMHDGATCDGALAAGLAPAAPCPRYTPGLRDLAERFREYVDEGAGLAVVVDGLLLHDARERVWRPVAEAPLQLLRERAFALRAFFEAALAAYEVRAAAEAAAATEAKSQTYVAFGALYETLKRFRPQV